MVCWCETNDKEKTRAIADAEAHLVHLGALIEELTAKSATLSAEINTLNKEVTFLYAFSNISASFSSTLRWVWAKGTGGNIGDTQIPGRMRTKKGRCDSGGAERDEQKHCATVKRRNEGAGEGPEGED